MAVQAFVRSQQDCMESCQSNEGCGYFKYFDSADDRQPLMCYHLKSCSKRVIRDRECPLEPNNYIDHTLFVRQAATCREKCEDTPDCRFYHWYPIDYSPAPLYCYLFRYFHEQLVACFLATKLKTSGRALSEYQQGSGRVMV